MSEFRNTRTTPVPLASGRLVAPGDPCTPDLDSDHDQALIAEGAFVPVETDKTPTPKKEA